MLPLFLSSYSLFLLFLFSAFFSSPHFPPVFKQKKRPTSYDRSYFAGLLCFFFFCILIVTQVDISIQYSSVSNGFDWFSCVFIDLHFISSIKYSHAYSLMNIHSCTKFQILFSKSSALIQPSFSARSFAARSF